jgi:hypothetical protein
MPDWRPHAEELLTRALREFCAAAEALRHARRPGDPTIRPRTWRVASIDVTTADSANPSILCTDRHILGVANGGLRYGINRPSIDRAVAWLIDDCEHRPRRVLALARAIDQAADWCDARRTGLLRAREEIVRQQQGAVETILLEASAARLAAQGDK